MAPAKTVDTSNKVGIIRCHQNIGDTPISNIPTSGVFCAELDIPSWAKISDRCGKLIFFEYPKKHGS